MPKRVADVDTSHPPLGRTMARLARQVDAALSTIDLTTAQYRILIQLSEGDEASSSLAAKLAVSRPTVTAVVEGLVQRGFVLRTHSVEDRRQVSVSLTPAGESILLDADRSVGERMTELLSGIPADRAATAVDAMEHWRTAIENHRRRAHVGSSPRATGGTAAVASNATAVVAG